ncbi:MAG: hypothetical protein V4482_03645 [Pseudomonadota bacterium]
MQVFNFLKRWLLVLVFSVHSVFSVADAANGDAVERLMHQMSGLTEQLNNHETHHAGAKNTVVIGKTGAGKSTLITCLAGVPLEAFDGDEGFSLTAEASAGDVQIGHGFGAGTEAITSYYDADMNTIYWDCPGFDDPRGIEIETQNAILLRKLYNSIRNVNVFVVAKEADITGRATELGKLLGKMNIFSNTEQLLSCVSLVVTQQRDIRNMTLHFEKLQSDTSNVYFQDGFARALVNSVASRDMCVAMLPYPSSAGGYDSRYREGIFACIADRKPVAELDCNVILSAESREYVQGLSGAYNTRIKQYLTQSAEKLKAQSYVRISNANVRGQKADDLRSHFASQSALLMQIGAPESFVTDFVHVLDTEGLIATFKSDPQYALFDIVATFGELLDADLRDVPLWKSALTDVTAEISRLSTVETNAEIISESGSYEVGPFLLKRTEHEKQRRGVRSVTVTKEFWSKELEQMVVSQNITKFTDTLTLTEPSITSTRKAGETSPRERNGDSWR